MPKASAESSLLLLQINSTDMASVLMLHPSDCRWSQVAKFVFRRLARMALKVSIFRWCWIIQRTFVMSSEAFAGRSMLMTNSSSRQDSRSEKSHKRFSRLSKKGICLMRSRLQWATSTMTMTRKSFQMPKFLKSQLYSVAQTKKQDCSPSNPCSEANKWKKPKKSMLSKPTRPKKRLKKPSLRKPKRKRKLSNPPMRKPKLPKNRQTKAKKQQRRSLNLKRLKNLPKN